MCGYNVDNFWTALFNLTDHNYQKYLIEDITGYDSYDKKNINCNSLDRDNFLCSFFYATTSSTSPEYILFYINGNFNNQAPSREIKRFICKSCANTNVAIIEENEYFLCHHELYRGFFITKCHYYTYFSKQFEEGKNDITFAINICKSTCSNCLKYFPSI